METSKELKNWFMEKRIQRTVAALEKNLFGVKYFPTAVDACEEILQRIPSGSKIGIGGSMTLKEMGLFDRLEHREDVTFVNPEKVRETAPDFTAVLTKTANILRDFYTCDVYLTGTNAITEKGQLFNIDGVGNRVGTMCFGPKQVIVVAGQNKIVEDLDEAVQRVRHCVAPAVAKRISASTPCAETGVCVDCNSPARICNIFVVLHKKPMTTPVTVFLVGEELGL